MLNKTLLVVGILFAMSYIIGGEYYKLNKTSSGIYIKFI